MKWCALLAAAAVAVCPAAAPVLPDRPSESIVPGAAVEQATVGWAAELRPQARTGPRALTPDLGGPTHTEQSVDVAATRVRAMVRRETCARPADRPRVATMPAVGPPGHRGPFAAVTA